MDSDLSLSSKLDISKLKLILETLEDDLKSPYIQTRPKFADDSDSQLRHALSEISHREKDLIACIGISKHIIYSYIDLEEKSTKLQEKNSSNSNQIQDLTSENFKLKEKLHSIEDKYFEVYNEKNKLDEDFHRLESRLQAMKREKSKRSVKLSLDISNYKGFTDELSDLNTQYKEQLETEIGKSKLGYKKEADKKFQEYEQVKKDLLKKLKKQDKLINQLKEDLNSAKLTHTHHVQSTDADSYISSNRSRPSLLRADSPKYEFDEETNQEFFKESLESETLVNTSLCTPIKTLDIVTINKIVVFPKTDHFQDFTEEIFFNMVVNI